MAMKKSSSVMSISIVVGAFIVDYLKVSEAAIIPVG